MKAVHPFTHPFNYSFIQNYFLRAYSALGIECGPKKVHSTLVLMELTVGEWEREHKHINHMVIAMIRDVCW